MAKDNGEVGGGAGDVGRDARYGVRALIKTPGFTLVALITLTLGIGATTAMFSVLNTALGRSLPFPEADRLHLILREAWKPMMVIHSLATASMYT